MAAILLRLMAKQPEDRFADYDELIAALDAASISTDDAGAGIALAPLGRRARGRLASRAGRAMDRRATVEAPSHGSSESIAPMDSLVGLAELAGESRPSPGSPLLDRYRSFRDPLVSASRS